MTSIFCIFSTDDGYYVTEKLLLILKLTCYVSYNYMIITMFSEYYNVLYNVCCILSRRFRFIAEQVSHHPPISACHCDGENYEYWQGTVTARRL